MKNTLLLFAIFLSYYSSFSQKNFQPATIVTIDGQSITGEIDYKNWEENPSTILFRTDKSSDPKYYGVADLNSFKVSGDLYKRAIVDIMERTDNVRHLSDGTALVTKKDTVFLLTIVSGPKSLYHYADNVNHFYIENETGYEWLRFNRYKVTEEVLVSSENYVSRSQQYIATNKEYIGQLREYLKECSGFSDNIKYDLKSLTSVFVNYYGCRSLQPDYLQKPENEKVEIGILAGVSNTTFDVNAAENGIIGRADFSSSKDFAAGAFVDIVFPRHRGRISLNNEILYSAYKTTGEYRSATSSMIFDDYTYEFGYAYVKMNNMFRYKFFTNTVAIFLNAGVSNGFAVSETNKVTVVRSRTYSDEKTTTTDKGFNDTRKHELGILVGGGLRRNRASLELRAEKGMGPFGAAGFKADVMRYFALIGYRIR